MTTTTVKEQARSIHNDALMRARREALAEVYRKVNRGVSRSDIDTLILTDVRTQMPQLATVPGWTDGKTVTLNGDVLFDGTEINKALMTATGVNYHELAHVLFSPSFTSPLCTRVQREGMWNLLNVLLDQRDESFFVAAYGPARHFFTATCLRFLGNTPNQWATNYALVYGRKFLPADVVREFRKRFILKDVLTDIEDVIDEFRTLVFPRDEDVAFTLVKRFHDLINKAPEHPQPGSGGHGKSGDYYDVENVRKDNSSKQADQEEQDALSNDVASDDFDGDVKTDDDAEKNEDANDTGSTDGSSDDDADDGSNGEGDGDSDAGESSDGKGRGRSDSDGDGDDADENDESASGGSAAGSGSSDSSTFSDDELNQLINERTDEVENTNEVQDSVARQKAAFNNGRRYKPSKKRASGRECVVDDDHRALSKRLSRAFQKVRLDTESQWVRDQPTGRLDTNKAMSIARHGSLDVFDVWQEGLEGDEGTLEVVIALDRSSSMQWIMKDASETMWVVKKALEGAGNAHVTVLTYDDEVEVLYGGDERASKTRFVDPGARGGTMAWKALEEAARIFSVSRNQMRLLIMITDGEWGTGNRYRHDEFIKLLKSKEMNVTTTLIGLNSAVQWHGDHGFHIARDVEKPEDLTRVVRSTVTRITREAYRTRGGESQ